MTKSVEASRAHLQGQLRSKEAENNRLTVQLRVHTWALYELMFLQRAFKQFCNIRNISCVGGVFQTLERTLTEQKMEIGDLKGSITTLSVKAAHDKESLKKATRAQKLRAERFEAATEKCYAQLKEKV